MKKRFLVIAVLGVFVLPLSAVAGVRNADAPLERGTRYFNLCRFGEAIREFDGGLAAARKGRSFRSEEIFTAKLGLAYAETGDYRKAVYYFGEALSIAQRLKDRQRVAEDLVELGAVNGYLGNYRLALSYYEDVLRIMRDRRNRNGSGGAAGKVFLRMAEAHMQMGERQKAVGCLNSALRLFVSLNDRRATGTSFISFGDLYRHYGEHNRAAAYYESALRTGRELRDQQIIAQSLHRLGVTEHERGNYDRSVSCLTEALGLSRGMNDPRGTVDHLNALGATYLELKDYRNALESSARALEVARKTGSNLLISASLENRGRAYRATGDYAAALASLVQAATLREEAGLPADDVSASIADCYLEAGELEKAEAAYIRRGDAVRLGRLQLARGNYQRAIHYFYKVFEGNPGDRAAGDLIASYTGIGDAFAALADHRSAADNYAKAIALLEDRGGFLAANLREFDAARPYEGIIRSFMELGCRDEAFVHAEQLKLGYFSRALRSSPLPKERRGISPSIAQEEDDNLARIRSLGLAADSRQRHGGREDRAALEQELAAAREKQRRFVDRLRALYPVYASLHYPAPLAAQALKLKADEMLLEFEVTDDATYLFLVNGRDRRLRVRRIALSRNDLRSRVSAYLSALLNRQDNRPKEVAPALSARRLYRELCGDLLDEVPAGTSLVIVPDEILGIVPFDSLGIEEQAVVQDDSGANTRTRVFRYMGDRWHLSYAQSATWFNLMRARERYGDPGEGVLSVYDPALSSATTVMQTDGKSDMYAAIAGWKTYGARYDEAAGAPGDTVKGFPGMKEVAGTLSVLFGRHAATLARLPEGSGSIAAVPFEGCRYVVFGVNCILDETAPYIRQPFFMLSDGLASERYGKALAVNQLAAMHIPAEVALLPCSETGPLDATSGRGAMDAARALQMAGSDTVVLSLWRTGDVAAAALCNAFFTYLSRGTPPREALELAKRHVRSHGFASPFYWAGFILAGK